MSEPPTDDSLQLREGVAISPDAQARESAKPWWAVLTVWVVVNAVNVLQSAGFLSRVVTGERAVNNTLGIAILALAVPSVIALVSLLRSSSGWRYVLGPASFTVFCAFASVVDFVAPVEFRDPALPAVLVPYLVLFFGSIVLMGAPMYRIDRRRWLLTALTTVLLVGSMIVAMRAGVG